MHSTITKSQKVGMFVVGIMMVLSVTVLTFALFESISYAAEIEQVIADSFNSIYTKIGVVITAVATVAMGVCAFKWILGTDPQAVRQAKSWMLNIAIGLALFWFAKIIVNSIQAIAQQAG